MKTNPNTAAVTTVKPEELNEDEAAFALAQARQAKTPLGRRLWEIRARIVASGAPLLSWDEIDREIEERRGGSRQDDE
jgi:chorismate-pyruvate lyase